jgi:hypothetical protein
MSGKSRSPNHLTRDFPAAWSGNKHSRAYSEGGSVKLDAKYSATNAPQGAEKLKHPWEDSVILKGDICESVYWRGKDGEVSEGTFCMRKLGSEESIPTEKVFKNPSRRDSYWANVTNVGGFGKAEFDEPTTFVTDQGSFVISVTPRTIKPSPLKPSIAALYTGTRYMARCERGTMECTRSRDYFPPVRFNILPVTIPD